MVERSRPDEVTYFGTHGGYVEQPAPTLEDGDACLGCDGPAEFVLPVDAAWRQSFGGHVFLCAMCRVPAFAGDERALARRLRALSEDPETLARDLVRALRVR